MASRSKEKTVEKSVKALQWIVDILHDHQIPFQISGGLAARVYGSTRKLDDIDIDIPQDSFAKIHSAVQPHIIFGPEQFHDENWKLFIMTLDYHGQKIDLRGADKTQFFNKQTEQWEELVTDLSRVKPSMVLGIEASVISMRELITYKTKIARDVDIADVQEIMVKIRGYACKR